MDVYLYVDTGSVLHRLDPRPKFLLVVAVIFLAVGADHPLVPGTLLALSLMGIQVADAWTSLRRVRALLFIIFLFSTVVWTFFSQGATRLLGPVEVESVLFGVSTGLKLAATITASVVWLATTRNEEITTGFIKMGAPYRMAFAFSSALRMVPTFVGAGTTIIQAQKARGVDVESGNLLRRLRKHLPMLVPVFVTALRSANQLAMALEAKGFGARPDRTYLLELRLGIGDWLATGLALAGMAASFWMRLGGLAQIPGLVR